GVSRELHRTQRPKQLALEVDQARRLSWTPTRSVSEGRSLADASGWCPLINPKRQRGVPALSLADASGWCHVFPARTQAMQLQPGVAWHGEQCGAFLSRLIGERDPDFLDPAAKGFQQVQLRRGKIREVRHEDTAHGRERRTEPALQEIA